MNESKNPYKRQMNPDFPELKNSFCLFLDILGFSELIENSATLVDENSKLQLFYRIFIRDTKEIRFEWEHFTNSDRPNLWQTKMFSDNIILGCPLGTLDLEDYFGCIIVDIITLQFDLVRKGYFLRGGWVLDSLYIDDIVIFGKALIKAYRLEKKAIYPRIIISDKIKNIVLDEHIKYYSDPRESPQYKTLLKDENETIFINYLIETLRDDGHPYYDGIYEHKKIIESKLDDFREDKHILEKYEWVADYHNYFCRTFISECPDKYLISKDHNDKFFRLI